MPEQSESGHVGHGLDAGHVTDAAWAARRTGAPMELMHIITRHTETASGSDRSRAIGFNAQQHLLTKLSEQDEARSNATREEGRFEVAAELIPGDAESIIAIAESTDAGGTVVLDQTRVGRLSRIDAMQQQAMAKNTRERYGIRRLQGEAALARIDVGTFGLCGLRRDPLDAERLDSDPAVVFCADCAEAREQERGQR
jgi:DnaK suppressor protein